MCTTPPRRALRRRRWPDLRAILSQIATHLEYRPCEIRQSVTLLQQRGGIAPGTCIFSFAILAKPGLLANNPHR
jgi:hypothetical protein